MGTLTFLPNGTATQDGTTCRPKDLTLDQSKVLVQIGRIHLQVNLRVDHRIPLVLNDVWVQGRVIHVVDLPTGVHAMVQLGGIGASP